MVALLLLLLAGEGRPLFYWGARPAVVSVEAPQPGAGEEARVVEVHAACDPKGLVLRFSFDRPTREAMQLPDGTPVSGRLRAQLYLDLDDRRETGLDRGDRDPRSGAEAQLEVVVLSVGEDPEERRKASAVVTAALFSLAADGHRRTLWRGDSDATPGQVSAHGEWVEVRLPPASLEVPRPPLRLVLAGEARSYEGRLLR